MYCISACETPPAAVSDTVPCCSAPLCSVRATCRRSPSWRLTCSVVAGFCTRPREEPSGWYIGDDTRTLCTPLCTITCTRRSGAMLSRTRTAPVTRSASSEAVTPVEPCAATAPWAVSVVRTTMTRKVPSSVRARSTPSGSRVVGLTVESSATVPPLYPSRGPLHNEGSWRRESSFPLDNGCVDVKP